MIHIREVIEFAARFDQENSAGFGANREIKCIKSGSDDVADIVCNVLKLSLERANLEIL